MPGGFHPRAFAPTVPLSFLTALMPSLVAVPLCLLAVALPFLFGYADSPVSNFWPLWTSWICAAVLLVVAASVRWSRSDWARLLAGGLGLAAVVAGGIGLVQYAVGDAGLAPWLHASQPGLAAGNLRQRNQQATLLAMGAWALLWWVLHFRARQPRAWGSGEAPAPQGGRVLSSATGLLLAAAVVWVAVANAATASRTGALQWLLIVGLVLLWRRTASGPALRLACAGLLAYLVAAWVLPELLWRWQGVRADALFHRFADDSQPCTSRIALWSNVLTLIAQKPWVGWGWGELDYAHYVTLFPGDRFCVLLDNAHNLPLQLAVELGLPAALLLCGAFAAWCLGERPWREAEPARQLAWGLLAIIGLHSMLEYPLWYGPFQVVALFAMALLCWPRGLRQAPLVVAGAAVVLVVCGVAAWDYHRVSQLYKAQEDRAPGYRDDVHAKVTSSWLFSSPLQFAQLTTTPLTRDNAERMNALAHALLHYSPEPRVIQILVESALMLGRDDEAAFHMKRFRIAYPVDYAKWVGKASAAGSNAR